MNLRVAARTTEHTARARLTSNATRVRNVQGDFRSGADGAQPPAPSYLSTGSGRSVATVA